MTAEEMFNELGFKKMEYKWDKHTIIYSDNKPINSTDIVFDLDKKTFRIKVDDNCRGLLYIPDIPFNLIGAINKQIKEISDKNGEIYE